MQTTAALPVPEPGRRARKKARTRQAIYEAAMRLFLERGYGAVTVEDVCDAADVAKGTFFLHFPTKDALLAEYGRQATDDLHERLAKHRGGAASALRFVLHTLAERAEQHPEMVRLTVRETMARPAAIEQSTEQGRNLGMLMADLVRRGQAAGELRRGILPEVAGAVLVASYFTIVNIWATGSEKFDLTDVVEQSLKLVLHGLKKE
jgi:AcrR family transcriptional regulator